MWVLGYGFAGLGWFFGLFVTKNRFQLAGTRKSRRKMRSSRQKPVFRDEKCVPAGWNGKIVAKKSFQQAGGDFLRRKTRSSEPEAIFRGDKSVPASGNLLAGAKGRAGTREKGGGVVSMRRRD
ncbi:MAG: hypothetical protein NT105_00045 [Verrucomicrobia bacterium]|nr:hypothetical protein [Verrucomicrobiota bacterium]